MALFLLQLTPKKRYSSNKFDQLLKTVGEQFWGKQMSFQLTAQYFSSLIIMSCKITGKTTSPYIRS